MDIDDFLEAFLALIGLSMFFLFATGSAVAASTNPDSYIFIEYKPPIDFLVIILLLILDFFYLAIIFNQSLKFRESHNLNKRENELTLVSDKMKVYSVVSAPIHVFLIYFYIKYFKTAIATYLFLMIMLEILLIVLIFYSSYSIAKDFEMNGDL